MVYGSGISLFIVDFHFLVDMFVQASLFTISCKLFISTFASAVCVFGYVDDIDCWHSIGAMNHEQKRKH